VLEYHHKGAGFTLDDSNNWTTHCPMVGYGWKMNWKWFGRKRPQYYPVMFLQGLREIVKTSRSCCLVWHSWVLICFGGLYCFLFHGSISQAYGAGFPYRTVTVHCQIRLHLGWVVLRNFTLFWSYIANKWRIITGGGEETRHAVMASDQRPWWPQEYTSCICVARQGTKSHDVIIIFLGSIPACQFAAP
jgi:hypothetical protein